MLNRAINKEKRKKKQEKKHTLREMWVENLIRINRQFFGLTEKRKKRFAWKVQLGKDLR